MHHRKGIWSLSHSHLRERPSTITSESILPGNISVLLTLPCCLQSLQDGSRSWLPTALPGAVSGHLTELGRNFSHKSWNPSAPKDLSNTAYAWKQPASWGKQPWPPWLSALFPQTSLSSLTESLREYHLRLLFLSSLTLATALRHPSQMLSS